MIWNYKDPSENADGFRLKTNLSKCLIACLKYFYVIHRASIFTCLLWQGKPFNLSSCFVHNHSRNGIIMIRNLDCDIWKYLSSKAIGCQWVFVFVCFSLASSKTANPHELKFWGPLAGK